MHMQLIIHTQSPFYRQLHFYVHLLCTSFIASIKYIRSLTTPCWPGVSFAAVVCCLAGRMHAFSNLEYQINAARCVSVMCMFVIRRVCVRYVCCVSLSSAKPVLNWTGEGEWRGRPKRFMACWSTNACLLYIWTYWPVNFC